MGASDCGKIKPTQRPLSLYVRWGCLFFLFFTMRCTCDVRWKPSQGYDCDPHSAKYRKFVDGQQLVSLLAQQPDGVPACLQLGWGQGGVEKSLAQFVWVDQQGRLFRKEENKSMPPSLVLPQDSSGQSVRFRLFVFSPSFQGDARAYCSTKMNMPNYSCLAETEQGACLAYMDFQPISSAHQTNSSTALNDGSSTCKLYLRPTLVELTPTEPWGEQRTNKDAGGEEARAPEESKPEEEPSKESRPEAGQPEEDSPKESRPESNPSEEATTMPEEPVVPEPSTSDNLPTEPLVCRQQGRCPWIKVGGGKGEDHIHDMAVTANGDIYVVGAIQSAQAQMESTTVSKTFGGKDIFVAKFNASGQLQWLRVAGSSDDDEGWAITHDGNQSLYVVGFFSGKATFGTVTLAEPDTTNGSKDMFVAKMDTSGTWIWVVRGTGEGDDYLTDVTVGPQGNLYVGGPFFGKLKIDQTTYSNSPTPTNGKLSYVLAKLDTTGKWLWSQQLLNVKNLFGRMDRWLGPWILNRGAGASTLSVVGNFGNKFVLGPYTLDQRNSFVASMDATGAWKSATVGGKEAHHLRAAAMSPNGDVVVLGESERARLEMGTVVLSHNKHFFPFLAALDSKGQWKWGVALKPTGTGECQGTAVAVDASGDVYVGGILTGGCVFGSTTLKSNGSPRMFLAKWQPQSQTWAWALEGGGTYPGQPLPGEAVHSIQVDTKGSVFVGGSLFSPRFGTNTTSSALQDLQLFLTRDPHP